MLNVLRFSKVVKIVDKRVNDRIKPPPSDYRLSANCQILGFILGRIVNILQGQVTI